MITFPFKRALCTVALSTFIAGMPLLCPERVTAFADGDASAQQLGVCSAKNGTDTIAREKKTLSEDDEPYIINDKWIAKDSDVYWRATIYNPKRLLITEIGIEIDYAGHSVTFTQKCPEHLKNNACVPLSFGMIHDLNIPILPVTGYLYTFFAVIGGIRYEGTFAGFSVGPDVSQYTNSTEDNKLEMDTLVPYYSADDAVFAGQSNGYRICSLAMVLCALDIPKASLEEVYAFNDSTVFLKSLKQIEEHYGVSIETRELHTSGAAREQELADLIGGLSDGRRVAYVNATTDFGAHAFAVYLDPEGGVRFNDPGTPGGSVSSYGENITLAENAMYYNETSIDARWDSIGKVWLIRRVN